MGTEHSLTNQQGDQNPLSMSHVQSNAPPSHHASSKLAGDLAMPLHPPLQRWSQ